MKWAKKERKTEVRRGQVVLPGVQSLVVAMPRLELEIVLSTSSTERQRNWFQSSMKNPISKLRGTGYLSEDSDHNKREKAIESESLVKEEAPLETTVFSERK